MVESKNHLEKKKSTDTKKEQVAELKEIKLQENAKKQEEMVEEKEVEAKKTPKKNKRITFKGIPVYLWAIFLILGLVGGIALHALLVPRYPIVLTPPEIPVVDVKPVEVQLIYSDECKFCLKHNTILDLFDQKGIEFTLQEFEASTEQGKQKIEDFRINVLPAALVPTFQMIAFPEIKQAMDESFARAKGFYVVPESNLDSSKIYSRTYLNPIYATDCNAADPKSKVIIFDDPYNEISIRSFPIIHRVLTDFNEFVDTEFEYIQANTSTLFEDANALLKNKTSEYLVCASILNDLHESLEEKFVEVYTAVISTYCNLPTFESDPNLIPFCNLSTHFGNPLTLQELDQATSKFSEDEKTRFESCLEIAPQRNLDAILRATKYGIHRTGTAIVDCKYNVPLKAIDDAICARQQDIPLCKADE